MLKHTPYSSACSCLHTPATIAARARASHMAKSWKIQRTLPAGHKRPFAVSFANFLPPAAPQVREPLTKKLAEDPAFLSKLSAEIDELAAQLAAL